MRAINGILVAATAVLVAIANAAPDPCSAGAILRAASQDGKISTLSLTCKAQGGLDLQLVPPPVVAGASPSWLVKHRGHLYVIDEGANATVTEYYGGPQGTFQLRKDLKSPAGGVHGAVYAGGRGLAVAHYAPPAISTYRLGDPFQPLAVMRFASNGPGPNPSRQEAPHPHQIVVHPSDNYILVPDLGSDLVHVFSIDQKTLGLSQRNPLKVDAGSGPRHAVFGKDGSFFYLVSELSNTVTVYKSTALPDGKGMTFDLVGKTDTFAGMFAKDGKQIPSGAAASEIALSPSGNQIIVSNRKDNYFSQSGVSTDSLATYSIDPENGALTPIGIFSATGSVPRQFALNKKGDLAAVGLQENGTVSIVKYDASKGKFGEKVADAFVGKQVVCVIWN